MFIRIQENNGLAIYEQIVRQIKFAVAEGTLSEGDLVPSVRELAKDLAINPNTVARSYQLLQSSDVLENIRGTGLAVKKNAQNRCRKERIKLIQGRLRQVLLEAKQSNMKPDELESIIESEMGRLFDEKRQTKS